MAVSILYPSYRNCGGGVPQTLFSFVTRFWAAGPVPETGERTCDPFGWILKTCRTFWTHLGTFVMIQGQTDYLRLEQRDIGTGATSETSILCVETRQMFVLATEEMSVVETRQMCCSETG